MRHAGPATFERLEPFFAELRSLPQLKETRPGAFSRKSKAFIHFHEDDESGIHADVRFGEAFERVRIETDDERGALLSRIKRAL